MQSTIITSDALTALQALPGGIADTCVTSPPYYMLRDYQSAGQIGVEATPEKYIDSLVNVFREVRRVLRDDGTLWVVIGDTYAGSRRGGGDPTIGLRNLGGASYPQMTIPNGCKPKDLIGIPWMLAFALQADGWYLRQDIIWHKPNAMPESVKDRCTAAHEHIFMLAKARKYYYDGAAISEAAISRDMYRYIGASGKQQGHSRRHAGFNGRYADKLQLEGAPKTRNRRNVWTVATRPYAGAHFATFPPELIRPCILAGSRLGGLVLDPFVGSGTTAEVAIEEGRECIGIELNPAYADMARARLDKARRARQDEQEVAR